jgi:hypothetical protein
MVMIIVGNVIINDKGEGKVHPRTGYEGPGVE